MGAIVVAIGMLSGYCGTLMTPMAANFNIVPTALLELEDQYQVIKVQIPTALAQHQPHTVLCVGQADGCTELCIERVAINLDDAGIPDNAGAQPIDQSIVPDGPTAYFSTLPIKAIVQALHTSGIPAVVSNSAGTYVCNHVFYGLLHAASSNPLLRRAGFIHIPYLPQQALQHAQAPSMGLALVQQALLIALETSMAAEHDLAVSGGSLY